MPLGGNDPGRVIPGAVIEITRSLRHFIVEDLRTARRYLRMIDKSFPIDSSDFFILNEHTPESEVSGFLKHAIDGQNMGLMSEAGLPGIADPGMILVRHAHRLDIRVVPLAGPSSILLGLIASGLNGQSFTFHGYLPVKTGERNNRLKEIEKRASSGEAQIFMETPYRAGKMVDSILETCHSETTLCIAADITLPTEFIKTKKIAEWRKNRPTVNDRPAVFIIGL